MWKKWTLQFLFMVLQALHCCWSMYEGISQCACETTDESVVADCSGSNFTNVPQPEPRYQVNVLNLQFNRIASLRAGDFRLYSDLEELYVQGNRINIIEEQAFDGLQRLRKLDLSKNMIQVLPSSEMNRLSRNLVWVSVAMNSLRGQLNLSHFNKLTHLDLSNNRFITDLKPGSLPSSLKELDLHYTGVKQFRRSAFHNLANLKSLLLSDNMASASVKFEIGVFDNLTSLEFLDLSRCFCKKLPRTSFANLKNLRALLLNHCWMTAPPILDVHTSNEAETHYHSRKLGGSVLGGALIPTDQFNSSHKSSFPENATNIWHNPRLSLLDLSNNRRMTIKLGQMRFPPSLTELKLRHINIPVITNDLFRGTTSIKKLDLCRSKVRVIEQDSFVHLRNSSEICLSGNPMEIAPRLPSSLLTLNLSNTRVVNLTRTTLGELKNVLEADIRRSRVEFVDDFAFANMTSLRTLDLSENLLRVLTRHSLCVGSMFCDGNHDAGAKSSLTSLNLSLNFLAYIETGAFATHGNLVTLDLQSNSIELVDKGVFEGLANLKTLKLNGNAIVDITPRAFEDLTDLEVLHLEQNKIEIIHSGTFDRLNSMRVLHLQENNLIFVHEVTFTSLEYLDMSFNNLTTFPKIGGKNLREVKARKNLIEIFKSGTLQKAVNLQILDLSRCKINHIEYNVFDDTPKLKSLDLSVNHIKSFLDKPVPSLEYLSLAENEISSVTNIITNVCPVLQRLDFGYNNISSLHPDVFHGAASLREVDLTGNNFQCDCALLPLVEWMEEHFDIVAEPDFYLCDGPADVYAMPVLEAVYDLECDDPKSNLRDEIHFGISISVAFLCLLLLVLLTVVIHRKSKHRRRETEHCEDAVQVGREEARVVKEERCCEPFKLWCLGLNDYTRDRRQHVTSDEGKDLMSASPVTLSTSETEGSTPV